MGSLNSSVTGQGQPLLWAHGLMLSMNFESRVGWLDWSLLAKAARVVRYDARGHGQSERGLTPESYRWDRLGEDMLALADEKGIKTFVAGGHSMGAATALFAALFAPERVKALVLMTPPTAWESRATQVLNYRKMADRLQKKGIESIAKLIALSPAMPEWMYSAHPEKGALAVSTVREFQPETLSDVLLGAGLSNLPDTDRLASLGMPALILAWSGDHGHPLETSERLAETLPNSQLVVANTLADVATWSERIKVFLNQL